MNKELLAVAAKINKKLGEGTVVLANEMAPIQRMTTGSLSFDVILGGGWPLNRWVELVGEPSHGKTAVALKTISANQQKNADFTCVWVASESFSPQYAELCGVDLSRVMVIETNSMEDAFDSVIAFCESKSVDLIVIDSLPALVPSSEDEKSMQEFTVGRGALLVNKFFRKVESATKRAMDGSERPVLGLMINQWRMKIGVMHGDPRTTPGGVGKDYAFAVRAEIRRDEWIEQGTGQEKRRIGQTIRMRTIKNKTAPPQASAFVDFYFDDGVVDAGTYDYGKEIVALAVLHSLVERKGAWFYYGERKWQGAQGLVDSVREEIDLKEELETAVLGIIRAQGGVA